MEKERKRNDGKKNVKKSIHCYGCRNNDDSNARNAVSAAESSSAEAAVKKNPMITKQITKESNIYAPKTTFKFTVAPGTAVPGK